MAVAVSPALKKLQASASKTSSKAEAHEAIKTSRCNELNTTGVKKQPEYAEVIF